MPRTGRGAPRSHVCDCSSPDPRLLELAHIITVIVIHMFPLMSSCCGIGLVPELFLANETWIG